MSQQITRDLMAKVAGDIRRAMTRTLAISPDPKLPVAMSGGAAAIGIIAGVLGQLAGSKVTDEPNRSDTILLAALLVANIAIDGKMGIENAYRDLKVLRPDAAIAKAKTKPKTADR